MSSNGMVPARLPGVIIKNLLLFLQFSTPEDILVDTVNFRSRYSFFSIFRLGNRSFECYDSDWTILCGLYLHLYECVSWLAGREFNI